MCQVRPSVLVLLPPGSQAPFCEAGVQGGGSLSGHAHGVFSCLAIARYFVVALSFACIGFGGRLPLLRARDEARDRVIQREEAQQAVAAAERFNRVCLEQVVDEGGAGKRRPCL